MASISKVAKGYRVQVKLKGVRDSKVFPTRREASAWGAKREAEILEGLKPEMEKGHTLRDALKKYSKEVTPKNKGAQWEQVRLKAFERYELPIDKPITQVEPSDIAKFRDSRLESVQGSSVRREMNLLNSAFDIARKEWGWITVNPCKDVKRPPEGRNRERVIQWWEVKRMLRGLGYRVGTEVQTVRQAVGASFMLALRTGMRAGEMCNLEKVDVEGRVAFLDDTKNSDSREVPITPGARRVIKDLERWSKSHVVGLTTRQVDSNFRAVRNKVGLEGFTFHDSRHTAATIFAKKVHVLELCKIMGWKNVKQALTYFNPSTEDLVSKLS